jgi:hypothetical protein
MDSRPSLAERATWPPVLDPEDLATVLGIPSARAAREFLQNHGIPHIRAGGRVYVLTETLLTWMKGQEARRESKAEISARADATVRAIAPTTRERQRGRKPPKPRED